MAASLGSLFKLALGLSPSEASFAKRGFWHADNAVREHLECVGANFLKGYNFALADRGSAVLTASLEEVENEFRGFAYEGAAMALAILDQLIPWKRTRLQSFIEGPGSPHVFMLYVGAGWSLARLPFRRQGALAKPHPVLRWLELDGYGFHEGFFRWPSYINKQIRAKRLTGYASRVFDQGLGRSLWFVEGADVERIASTIRKFPVWRQADLWSGVGLACAYAGGADESAVEVLRRSACCYRNHLAQGAAFAAKTRQRANNLTDNTERVCKTLCGVSAAEAALITDSTRDGLPESGPVPAYEVWRQRIQNQFSWSFKSHD
jgi:hypothetical protein